jgi:hypothetical protein
LEKSPEYIAEILGFPFLENLTLIRVEKRIYFGWFFEVVDLGLGKRNSAKFEGKMPFQKA